MKTINMRNVYPQVAYNNEDTGLRKVIREFYALAYLNPDRSPHQIANQILKYDSHRSVNSTTKNPFLN